MSKLDLIESYILNESFGSNDISTFDLNRRFDGSVSWKDGTAMIKSWANDVFNDLVPFAKLHNSYVSDENQAMVTRDFVYSAGYGSARSEVAPSRLIDLGAIMQAVNATVDSASPDAMDNKPVHLPSSLTRTSGGYGKMKAKDQPDAYLKRLMSAKTMKSMRSFVANQGAAIRSMMVLHKANPGRMANDPFPESNAKTDHQATIGVINQYLVPDGTLNSMLFTVNQAIWSVVMDEVISSINALYWSLQPEE